MLISIPGSNMTEGRDWRRCRLRELHHETYTRVVLDRLKRNKGAIAGLYHRSFNRDLRHLSLPTCTPYDPLKHNYNRLFTAPFTQSPLRSGPIRERPFDKDYLWVPLRDYHRGGCGGHSTLDRSHPGSDCRLLWGLHRIDHHADDGCDAIHSLDRPRGIDCGPFGRRHPERDHRRRGSGMAGVYPAGVERSLVDQKRDLRGSRDGPLAVAIYVSSCVIFFLIR